MRAKQAFLYLKMLDCSLFRFRQAIISGFRITEVATIFLLIPNSLTSVVGPLKNEFRKFINSLLGVTNIWELYSLFNEQRTPAYTLLQRAEMAVWPLSSSLIVVTLLAHVAFVSMTVSHTVTYSYWALLIMA